jgi:ferritin-like metal-binding protein YciE
MANGAEDTTRHYFITGLKNAHALEKEALGIMNRQIDHLQNYPEVEQRLRQHVIETEHQIERLDAVLDGFGEKASGLKDAALNVMGNMAALGHTMAPDEILKNSFANYAFEHFEIASYRSLIVIAEQAGFQNTISALQTTLKEEEAMAAWVGESLPMVTQKFLMLKAQGETASH